MKEALQLRGMLGSFLDFCIWAHTSIYVLSIIRVAQNIRGDPCISFTWIIRDVVLGITERRHAGATSQSSCRNHRKNKIISRLLGTNA